MVTGCASSSSTRAPRVMFNQDFIAHEWSNAGMPIPSDAVRIGSPVGTDDIAVISPDEGVRFDDPKSVVALILKEAPRIAYVLPTERYFYYQFHLGPELISGNLRFTDIENGQLHAGYFDARKNSRTNFVTLTEADGLVLDTISKDRVRVSYAGETVEFILNRFLDQPPARLELYEGESFVAGVLDESGVPLALLWSNDRDAFYFVLHPDFGSPEPLIPFGSSGDYFVGRDTRFVYLRDESTRRMLLAGVLTENIRANNYYDGPFDQVPPDLSIGGKLERAYPYVKYRGGIDDHGNFNQLEGSRVAISPYLAYQSLEEMESWLDSRRAEHPSGPDLFAAVTYEPKRDFHHYYSPQTPRTLGELLAMRARALDSLAHATYSSQGWPANHHVESSNTWPSSHQKGQSGGWPADHVGESSEQKISGQ